MEENQFYEAFPEDIPHLPLRVALSFFQRKALYWGGVLRVAMFWGKITALSLG